MIGLTILGVIVIVLAVFLISIYNSLVQLRQRVQNSWAQVDVQLKRRYDLIPNLVNTVKGYAAHETELFEEVTRLRSQWGEAKAAGDGAESIKAAGLMESALGRLMVVVENYPELKANQNFLALQDELAGTENRISTERRRYNEAVASYNVKIRKFPNSLFAGSMGLERKTPFEAQAEAATAPKVEF